MAISGPPATLPAPVVRHLATPAWSIHVRAVQGAVRSSMQDAHVVLAGVACAGRPCDVVAIFDGVGGHPRGGEAAKAAADAMPEAARTAASAADLLARLQPAVLATGGATTAVVVLLPRSGGRVELAWAGDSSAYALDATGALVSLAAPDSEDSKLTQCLGVEGVRPHAAAVEVPPEGAALACTDGVDSVLGALALQPVLAGPASQDRGRLDGLFEAIAAAGSPDNATCVLARRRSA